MTEHHGLDLDEIVRANGGHSIFAPSGSAMWLGCSGSLIPNLQAPDNAGKDAAYGTVGHEVAETWLNSIAAYAAFDDRPDGPFTEEDVDACEPLELVGTMKTVVEPSETFEIEIDEDMLAYVRQYIMWCIVLPGKHYVEVRGDFSRLTPIPKQGGTADHAACSPGLLVISDLKMGKGEQVFAAVDVDDPRALVDEYEAGMNGNSQALIYAICFFYAYDALYNFERIVVRIAQPRLDHWHVWETTREELLKFAEFVKVRAAAAWVPGAPRSAGKKTCRWCKIKGSCGALLALVHRETDDVFSAVVDEPDCSICLGLGCEMCRETDDAIEGQFTVIGSKDIVAARRDLADDKFMADPRDPAHLTTPELEKLLPLRKLVESWFSQVEVELTKRAKNGDPLERHKLVTGRSGRRKWLDDKDAAEELVDFIGVPEEAIHESKMRSPAQIEEKMKTLLGVKPKSAQALISHLTTQSEGRPTLVLLTDKREALEDVGAVFDPVEDDEI